jgi:peptide/nickel transport system permease protein/oligopeptide transport system permease protein
MLLFLMRRAISLIFVLFSLTFLTFMVGRLVPGDPIQVLMGPRRDPTTYARLRHQYGLDQPLLTQYASYALGLVRGDLGLSFRYEGRPVSSMISQGIPVSVQVGGIALILSLLIGVPLGLLAALRRNSFVDRAIAAVTLALYAIPSFVLIPIVWIFNLALYRAGYPSLPQAGWGRPEHLVLPVLTLAAANVGYLARLTRAATLEILSSDFIRTARAKGLRNTTVIGRHVLRNALLPILTLLGPATAALVTGAFVIENLFNIPGIGRIAVEAIGQRDYPIIQGTTIILGAAVVVMNTITDILYRVADPRISLTE